MDLHAPSTIAKALWYVAPGQAEIRPQPLAPCSSGEVRIRALYGAISRGTESLIRSGGVPPEEYERMRAPFMEGTFPFPVKYGYATVGCVEDGPQNLVGKMVFALFPHQDHFNLSLDSALVLPQGLNPARAVLAANMETALNAVWNAKPAPADHIAIVGAGVVGFLVGFLCGQLPGAKVTIVDTDPRREPLARALGLDFAQPDAAPLEQDLVIHASGNPAGLKTALSLAGLEATILELSWYGQKEVCLPLGGAFHSRQLKIISSQVGHVAASHRARWTHKRRLEAALGLLSDARLDVLLEPAVHFQDLPAALPRIFDNKNGILCQLIQY